MKAVILFPIRFFAFIVGALFYYMESAADWLIGTYSRTEYIRQGSCNRCGRCCRLLALEMPSFVARNKYLVHFFIWLHALFFNFQYEGQNGKWLVYRCGYFVDEDPVRCRIYPFRHRLCRYYPRQHLYGHPKVHVDCGFKFMRRDGKPTFDEILAQKKSAN